jgi:trehalose/maltose transport system substrate-binding protein
MRNWPYAYALGNGDDTPIKGMFDVAPLPSGGEGSAATLGGWNLAVSKFSPNPDAAIELALYLTSPEVQKRRAIENANLPTIMALYDDPEIAAAQPIVTRWKDVFMQAVPRPSAPTKVKYNEVSAKFWSAVHETLSGATPAADSLELLEIDLDDISSGGW